MYRTGEAHAPQVIEKIAAEAPDTGEENQIIRGKTQALDIIERLLEPRCQQKPPRLREPSHEQLENRLVLHAALEVRLRHRQLVQVGEQRFTTGLHRSRIPQGRLTL